MSYQREQEIAIQAVREAAILCQAVQSRLSKEVLEKKDKSPVTIADFGSQALICRTIREAFPDDPIIAEEDSKELKTDENAHLLNAVVQEVTTLRPGVEAQTVCDWIDFGGAQSYSDRFWTLDPIDGTKGFLRGQQYAIALALIVEGQIEVAALACPNLSATADQNAPTGVIYTAIRGQGATTISLEGTRQPDQISVSDTANTTDARFCESVESGHTSHSHSAQVGEQLGITEEPVRLDSQAKYAIVARGQADIYLRLPTRPGYVEKIWDHAAGCLVVTEAGGQVTDIHGKPLDFSRGAKLENNAGVIVTNGTLHNQVLDAVNAVGVAAL